MEGSVSFEEIKRVLGLYQSKWMAKDFVSGVGIGQYDKGPNKGEYHILVYLNDGDNRADIPSEVEGIKVEQEYSGGFSAL